MRLGPPRHPKRVVDLINRAAALAPAANVIMQLALPGVGYGVLERGYAVPRAARNSSGMTQHSRSGGITWRLQP
jgi:uncharacterized protein (DUF2236 family)